jgi:hypothetical protein
MHPERPGGPADSPTAPLTPRLCAALALLLEAHNYARDLKCSPWDFAFEINGLLALGLNNNDLRWLLCRGYLEHAREITRPAEDSRTFCPVGKLTLTRRTCFILTPEGVAAARTASGSPLPPAKPAAAEAPPGNGAVEPLVPHWDAARQQLRLNGTIVKQFKVPSPNQETVLAAFEEEGWPPRIDDPLSPRPDLDPKRRLHDTISTLNRNQKQPLLRFLGDGSGQGVRWELAASLARTVRHDPTGLQPKPSTLAGTARVLATPL